MKFILPNQTDTGSLFISFMTLRRSIGYLAFFLAPVLIVGSLLLDDTKSIYVSMSAYYYSHIRNVLVGVICGISLFLFCYHGYKWYDSLASKSAALFALGIAFFPTSETNDKTDIISILHYVTSGIIFVILSIMSIFLFTKTSGDMTTEKIKRNRVYRICGIVMLISVVGIPIAGLDFIWDKIKHLKPTFFLETIALVAFGISWMTKGGVIFGDKQVPA